MKKSLILFTVTAALLLTLSGCGQARPAEEPRSTAEAPAPAEAVMPASPAGTSETASPPSRQNGERFETVIILEGMEETVRYEHIRNEALGFEMDYDYESFVRRSEADRECFVSVWDDADHPENYLEVRYDAGNADSVAAAIAAALSGEYEVTQDTRALDSAGDCIRLEASVIRGTNNMADRLQAVYIIPAADGCRVAVAHYSAEAAEGFGRRFNYLMNTLLVIERSAAGLSDEQALSAVRNACYAADPTLEGIVNAGEYPVYWEIESGDARQVVVLFRSYTGAQLRYYVDRSTGNARVTEFVPGITPEEMPAEESLNLWDYCG